MGFPIILALGIGGWYLLQRSTPGAKEAKSAPPPEPAAMVESEPPAAEVPSANDPLIDINGIGPTYARRLNDAGICTFADLATLTIEQVREIVKARPYQATTIDSWLAEAQALAG